MWESRASKIPFHPDSDRIIKQFDEARILVGGEPADCSTYERACDILRELSLGGVINEDPALGEIWMSTLKVIQACHMSQCLDFETNHTLRSDDL